MASTLLVLVVLVTICSLHVDHVAATKCASGKKNCDKNMRCNSGRIGLRKCRGYPNAIPTCKDGCCSAKCKPGYGDCNRNMARDGCETFIAGDDRINCGGCGKECRSDQYPNAVFSCKSGKCGILMCHYGRTDCNGKLEDGCEIDTDNSPLNCGSCGSVCPVYPNSVAHCYNEFCRYTCKEGFVFCEEVNESNINGCFDPSNFQTDANHCGRCYSKCAVGQSCQQGVCR